MSRITAVRHPVLSLFIPDCQLCLLRRLCPKRPCAGNRLRFQRKIRSPLARIAIQILKPARIQHGRHRRFRPDAKTKCHSHVQRYSQRLKKPLKTEAFFIVSSENFIPRLFDIVPYEPTILFGVLPVVFCFL